MEGGLIKSAPVPLPIEIPRPPDLSKLPSHILHSGTVETLIGHNEDLTARLMVNIRRNSVLEAQILEQERLNNELVRVNNSILSQVETYQEKDRIYREKTSQVDDRHELLEDQLSFMKTKVETLEDANENLRDATRAAVRFQRRVRSWVRPLLSRLKSELTLERSLRLKNDALVSDLRNRLNEAVQEARSLENKYTRDQTKLVEQYESRLAAIHNVKEKAQRFDEAIAKKAELENKVIFLERKRNDVESSLSNEVKSLQAQMVQYRQEAKTTVSENIELRKDLESRQSELNNLSDQYMRLQDQFESMQSVWAESQRRIEASKLQQETLNKLNQELSRQLKESRRGQDL
jgi:DNA repair exonuclease SbcCD ATPase subunit